MNFKFCNSNQIALQLEHRILFKIRHLNQMEHLKLLGKKHELNHLVNEWLFDQIDPLCGKKEY